MPEQDQGHPAQSQRARYELLYLFLASTFSVVLVLTNVIGIKLFVNPLNPESALTAGLITYPLTFLMTDLVSELYGAKRANYMVILGFLMSLVMLIITQLAVALPPHPAWVPPEGAFFDTLEGYQRGFASVFALNGVLLFASMSAYLAAQLIDVWLYHCWKRVTQGRHLWLRNNGSTLFSQLVDTFIVGTLFLCWGLGLDWSLALSIMIGNYTVKLLIALCDTPLIYLSVWGIRRMLGVPPIEEVEAATPHKGL